MDELINYLIENDKVYAPLLLAASFNGLVTFKGSRVQHDILYWQFYPKDKALELLNQYRTKTEPHIPAKDIFEATETWWKEIAEMKHGGIKNGRAF